jgi:pimeloyl-ACP methyl ester carboxylesterase
MSAVFVTQKPKPFLRGELFGFVHAAAVDGRVGAILLNAGLLHNVGPFRLYNRIAEALATAGITVARIDQSGKGESPSRERTTDGEALIKDYDDVAAHLAEQGIDRIILVGLCSAADDALELATQRSAIVGVVMLDGYAPRDLEYFVRRYSRPVYELKRWVGLLRRKWSLQAGVADERIDIRSWRSRRAMLASIERFLARGGKMLAVFSGGVREYYNHPNQLARAVGNPPALVEIYFPLAAHTYPVSADRVRLVERVAAWAKAELADGPPSKDGAFRPAVDQAHG